MPDNENKRVVRFTVLLTKEEWRDLQGRAGLVPVGVWIRAMLFQPTTEVSGGGETGKVPMPARWQDAEPRAEGKTGVRAVLAGLPVMGGEQKIFEKKVEEAQQGVRERRGLKRGGSILRKVEDVAHAAVRKSGLVCGHGAAPGFCKKSGCRNHKGH